MPRWVARDTASFVVEDKTYTGSAEVRLDLLPRASIHVHIVCEGFPPVISNHTNSCQLSLERLAVEMDGFLISSSFPTPQGGIVVWSPFSEPIVGIGEGSTEISYVIFHLFNFKDLFRIRNTAETKVASLEELRNVEMEASGWSVELRPSARNKNGSSLESVGDLRLGQVAHRME